MKNKHLDNSKKLAPGTADLICFSHLRWNFVYQRPQHLMTRCARQRRVFFVEEPEYKNTTAHLKVEKDHSGIFIIKPYLPEGLNEDETNASLESLLDQFIAEEINEYILWYYTPMALDFSRHLKPVLTVYDCMDQLSLFKGAPTKLQKLEPELLGNADLIFTGGRMLYEDKRKGHKNVHLFPSSIDAAHFEQARKQQADPDDQGGIPHPRLGFFGVIDERMDLDLLHELALARPDWHMVILGPVVKIDPGNLPQLGNIHYLGMKPYAELPKYLSNWDVTLLPFALNDSTRFISPTKIPEYLAGGKPVVSTPIQDVIHPYGKKKLVSIATTAGDFMERIQSILQMKEKDRSKWLAKVDRQLSQASWDSTWEKMVALIESSLAVKEAENKKAIHYSDTTILNSQVDLRFKKRQTT